MKKYLVVILTAAVLSYTGCSPKKEESKPEAQKVPTETLETKKEQSKPEPEKATTDTSEAKKEEGNPEAEKAALAVAGPWLELVDSGNFDETWEQAAEFFKNAVDKEEWVKALKRFRVPLGKMVSREVKSTRYTESAPGAPDAEYVIIQYSTSFENKKSGIETITPMLDKDGKWRVSGYYIK
jgi:hypothetical protein